MVFNITVSDNDRQIILAGLDLLARNLGAQINQAGGNAARDGAMKLIAVDNVARAVAELQPAKAEEAKSTSTEE